MKTVMRAGLFAASLALVAPWTSAQTFNGANSGPIPDGNPAGLDVTFNVSGIASELSDVSVSMTLTHTWAGDVSAELIAPGGKARRVIFARTGLTPGSTFGAAANLAGTYVFSDRGGDWWATALTVPDSDAIIPPGEYRASTAGRNGAVQTGGCTAPITLAFDSLAPAQLNGVWTLRLTDSAAGDAGAISAAQLKLVQSTGSLFADGFEASSLPAIPIPRGNCVHAQFDYTGSNRTSYVVVRNTGGGSNGVVTWFIRDNDGTTNGAQRNFVLGKASDYFIGGDFDGDNVWDAAAWTPGNPGTYTIRLSSRPKNAPPLVVSYGKTGDEPTHAGDYDGDGTFDFALFRKGINSGDPSYLFIKLSSDGSERIIPAGVNGNYASGGLDMTGDGIADVLVQSAIGGGNAHFDIRDGSNGIVVSGFDFGKASDVIVAGNHSGSALADVTLVRAVAGNAEWTTRDTGTSTVNPTIIFGASATDFALSGDFDGDGLDDHAIWRPSATPGASKFSIRPSATPATPFDVPFGANGDYPVANSRTH